MGKKYIVGRNMPGYLPDSEPYTVDSFDRAKRCLLEDLQNSEESAESEEAAEIFSAEREDVNLWSEGDSCQTTSTMPDGLVYWIEEEVNYLYGEILADYINRAKSEREAGGECKINEGLPTVAVTLSDRTNYFFQGQEAEELLAEVPANISAEDYILASAQDW